VEQEVSLAVGAAVVVASAIQVVLLLDHHRVREAQEVRVYASLFHITHSLMQGSQKDSTFKDQHHPVL
jgi:hypothetical protein